MGKKILKLLLYLMAMVGVLIWMDSTEGLTEEGALIIVGIALLAYFVMKLIGFLAKRRRIRRERARKARRKRELREVNNHRGKQETGRKAENNRSGKWKSNVETYVPDVEQWKENVSGSGWQRERSQITSVAATAAAQVVPVPEIDLAPEKLADYDYLMNHFFIVDSATETTAEQINAAQFLAEDLTLPKEAGLPQILIYHSHSQETFCDSREGKEEDTIVGVGDYLTELLTETYGYQVMHVTEKFDLAGGELDRSKAYDYARAWLEPVLKENPSIQVVIDLHRDGVPDDRRLVTEINGKETAQLLFYNGLSHTINSGDLSYLPNPYIQDNLAFSFQLEYQAALYYPELYRGIYLAGLRYNLHLRPRALLLEAGAQTNTVQEVKNAMEPFADILDRVLQGK